MALKKGDVVKVVSGKSAGESGKVFWIGQTKFGKTRIGIENAAGAKVWAAPTEVVNADGTAVQMPLAALTLEDRVAQLEQQVAVLMAALTEAKNRKAARLAAAA